MRKYTDVRSGLTQAILKEYLHYDPDSGLFWWKVDRPPHMFSGDLAGCTTPKGYRLICILGVGIMAHRLAYLYMTGEWPEEEIDHIDCNSSNNAWCNLRPATALQNGYNKKLNSRNKVGSKGVHRRPNGTYRSRITVNKKILNLGTFKTAEDAHAAYVAAAEKYFGEFARAA